MSAIESTTANGLPPEVLTLSEAAALLRVSEDALRQLASESAVPTRQIGGEWRFSQSALLAWLRRTPPSEETGAVWGPRWVAYPPLEMLLAELERRLAAKSAPTEQPRAASPLNQKILELAGSWKDDPTVPELLKEIYRARGRPMTEEDE